MGPASYLYEMVSASKIEDSDDDQLYYTKLFLNQDIRVSEQLWRGFYIMLNFLEILPYSL